MYQDILDQLRDELENMDLAQLRQVAQENYRAEQVNGLTRQQLIDFCYNRETQLAFS
jgi:hypothetical protein